MILETLNLLKCQVYLFSQKFQRFSYSFSDHYSTSNILTICSMFFYWYFTMESKNPYFYLLIFLCFIFLKMLTAILFSASFDSFFSFLSSHFLYLCFHVNVDLSLSLSLLFFSVLCAFEIEFKEE